LDGRPPQPGGTAEGSGPSLIGDYPATPDGRYFVVRGRLWRLSDPGLPPDQRQELVNELMDARRKRDRARVDAAKRALGERGPVWWDDGAPDWNRHLAKNTPYADWWAAQTPPITT
jgi:hypothetical protein